MSAISHWLNRSLHVWRQSQTPDGSGGYTVAYVDQGSVVCKVDQSTGAERLAAAQLGSDHSHNIYCETDAGVLRNDKLAPTGVDPNSPGTGETYRVLATTVPSSPRYLKAMCEREELA
jgi:hypothetical protein